jgi:hypothetical protein
MVSALCHHQRLNLIMDDLHPTDPFLKLWVHGTPTNPNVMVGLVPTIQPSVAAEF